VHPFHTHNVYTHSHALISNRANTFLGTRICIRVNTRIVVSFAEYSLSYRALLQKRPFLGTRISIRVDTLIVVSVAEYSLFYRALLQKRPSLGTRISIRVDTLIVYLHG